MRLINMDTLELESFNDDAEAPPYAILSHTWGPQEVTLQDVLSLSRHELDDRAGWRKITSFCREATSGQFRYPHVRHAWVDTCCIDKTSSAELSEAINSMFRWYRNAVACYVLMSDVVAQPPDDANEPSSVYHENSGEFEKSRWFTRGWTLQELLAPRDLLFFDRNWQFFGDKELMATRISKRTRIDIDAIRTGSWVDTSIAQRMSWAADRQTTRREDIAYCLMGIFDVNMPLLYGEGEKAFIRLQEEIMKESDDQSILAWDASKKDDSLSSVGFLATHPSQFHDSSFVEQLPSTSVLNTTPSGIQTQVPELVQETATGMVRVIVLQCRDRRDMSSRVGIPIVDIEFGSSKKQVARTRESTIRIPLLGHLSDSKAPFYLLKRDRGAVSKDKRIRSCFVSFSAMPGTFEPVLASPAEHWHTSPARSMTMLLPMQDEVVTAVAFRFRNAPRELHCVVLKLFTNQKAGVIGLRQVNLEDGIDLNLSKMPVKTILDGLIEQVDSIAVRKWVKGPPQAFLKDPDPTKSSFDVVLTQPSVR